MINKVVASMLFTCFLFALSLYLLGVHEPIHLGIPFKTFLGRCSLELENAKFEIPFIPSIPEFPKDNGLMEFFDLLRKFVNFLVIILNFLVNILNYVIQLLEFTFIVIKNAIILRDTFVNA